MQETEEERVVLQDLVESVPTHRRGFGTRQSSGSPSTQTFLWKATL